LLSSLVTREPGHVRGRVPTETEVKCALTAKARGATPGRQPASVCFVSG
jgi:hypothetical protein